MKRAYLILVPVCMLALVFSACSRRRSVAVTPHTQAGTNPYHAGSPETLSEYIRVVLKISQENTAVEDEALAQLHKRKPELADLARRVSENTHDLDARHSLAAAYLDEKLYLNAFQLYQECRAIAPSDAAGEVGIGRIWIAWGDFALARQHADRAILLEPNSARGLELLGRIHMAQNEIDQALSAFLTAISIEQDNASLMANTGYLYYLRGDLVPARNFLERAIELNPFLVEAQNNLGLVLGQMGNRQGALRSFMAANGPVAAFNNLGVLYLSQKMWGEAREAFLEALELDPNYARARANLAEAESHLPPPTVVSIPRFDDTPGRGETVANNSRRRVAAEPTTAMAAANRIRVIGQPPGRARSDRAARLTAAYKHALDKVYKKGYQEAIDMFEWLLEQHPTSSLTSNCHFWIGHSFFSLGEYDKALVAFRNVLNYRDSAKRRDALYMIKRAESRARQKARVSRS